MLKTVSSITNAIGALNFKGTWNAATNTPTIVSGVGVKGDYFVVSVAGSTTIDGISNWGVGDWITYNGTVWQRVEGGADLNGVNLSVSGTTTLSNLTASTALALNASKEVVSVTNTGTGDNVLGTSPTMTTPRVVTSINDTNGNELLGVTATASAVNELTVANAATGNAPALSATGSDSDINILITPKGTGNTNLTAGKINVHGDAIIGQNQVVADATVGNLGIYGGLAGGSTNAQVSFFGKSVSNTGATYEIARISGSSFGSFSLDGGIQFSTASNNGSNVLTLAERMRISSTGIVTMSAYGAGAATFSAAGVISSVSDETWKVKDGVPVDPDAMLNKLEPGYWYYNEEKAPTFGADRQLGFYAQNVNAAIGPEAAPIPEEGKPWGYYDRSVLAITVMSLQKALATIETLNARISALETA